MKSVKKINIDISMKESRLSGKRLENAVSAVGAGNLNPDFGVIDHRKLGTKEHKKYKGIDLEEILED